MIKQVTQALSVSARRKSDYWSEPIVLAQLIETTEAIDLELLDDINRLIEPCKQPS